MQENSIKFNIVNDVLIEQQLKKDNYLIEDDINAFKQICCIYCSSHALYFPETKENFVDKIVNKNVFEWYKCRVDGIKRHIFIRDIRKQFYVEGISDKINSIDKLIVFLKEQTKGYDVITVGSSAGGYIAAILGSALNAKATYVFSGQFSLQEDFAYMTKELLLLHQNDDTYSKWYDIRHLYKSNMVYVYPAKSPCDVIQSKLVSDAYHADKKGTMLVFRMNEKAHGVPLYRTCIRHFINLEFDSLRTLANKYMNEDISSFQFSYRLVGMMLTLKGAGEKYLIKIRNIIRMRITK